MVFLGFVVCNFLVHSGVCVCFHFTFQCFKTGITHWFSIEAARRDFGYDPKIQNDLTEAVQWFKERGHGKEVSGKPKNQVLRFVQDLILAILFAIVIFSFLPPVH